MSGIQRISKDSEEFRFTSIAFLSCLSSKHHNHFGWSNVQSRTFIQSYAIFLFVEVCLLAPLFRPALSLDNVCFVGRFAEFSIYFQCFDMSNKTYQWLFQLQSIWVRWIHDRILISCTKQKYIKLNRTRTTRTPAFWDTPATHDYPY